MHRVFGKPAYSKRKMTETAFFRYSPRIFSLYKPYCRLLLTITAIVSGMSKAMKKRMRSLRGDLLGKVKQRHWSRRSISLGLFQRRLSGLENLLTTPETPKISVRS